jgi:4-hydroxy-tetrahydrodipicolinate synthase
VARDLQARLAPLTVALTRENPAALKYALCLLGLMSANTRLPIVEPDDSAKAEIASAITTIGDDEIAHPFGSGHDCRFHKNYSAMS